MAKISHDEAIELLTYVRDYGQAEWTIAKHQAAGRPTIAAHSQARHSLQMVIELVAELAGVDPARLTGAGQLSTGAERTR